MKKHYKENKLKILCKYKLELIFFIIILTSFILELCGFYNIIIVKIKFLINNQKIINILKSLLLIGNKYIVTVVPFIITILAVSLSLYNSEIYGLTIHEIREIMVNKKGSVKTMLILSMFLILISLSLSAISFIFTNMFLLIFSIVKLIIYTITEVNILTKDKKSINKSIARYIDENVSQDPNIETHVNFNKLILSFIKENRIETIINYLEKTNIKNKEETYTYILNIYFNKIRNLLYYLDDRNTLTNISVNDLECYAMDIVFITNNIIDYIDENLIFQLSNIISVYLEITYNVGNNYLIDKNIINILNSIYYQLFELGV